jgi:cobalt/nickel transport protein
MTKKNILIGLFAALILAAVISPFASSRPDGLERVAEDKGFLEKGEGVQAVVSSAPDYVFPGIKNEKVAKSLAGAVGTLCVFAAGYGVAAMLKKKRIR